MIFLAIVLSATVIFLVGYLVGFLHGRDAGEEGTYRAIEEYYQHRS